MRRYLYVVLLVGLIVTTAGLLLTDPFLHQLRMMAAASWVVSERALFADVSDHLPEYATLKAIGYSNRYLSGVVIQQAIILAALGYIPGFFLSIWLYRMAGEATQLPLYMTTGRAIVVLFATIGMCSVSALMALRKVRAADPAKVF